MKTQQDQVREALQACAKDASVADAAPFRWLALRITPEGASKLVRMLKL